MKRYMNTQAASLSSANLAIPLTTVFLCWFALLLLGCQQQAELQIDDAWIKAAPPGADVMVGYARIVNNSKTDYLLTNASSEHFRAIEMHTMSMREGRMRMRRLDVIELTAGHRLELKSGGKHFMLFGPKQRFEPGETLNFDLEFSAADGSTKVLKQPFKVRALSE